MLQLPVASNAQPTVANRYNHVNDLSSTEKLEPRIRSSMHSAYVRDLDNNKICFYTINA